MFVVCCLLFVGVVKCVRVCSFCFACCPLRGACVCVSIVVVVNWMWLVVVRCSLSVVGELLLGACRCVVFLAVLFCCLCLLMWLVAAHWLSLCVACCMLSVV